ncbi:MAG TPA: phospholipase A [Solimonas sp.]
MIGFAARTLLLALLSLAVPAMAQEEAPAADPAMPEIAAPESGDSVIVEVPRETLQENPELRRKLLFDNLARDLDVFTLVNDRHGLSFHKPMYVWPISYSPDYYGENTELIFQVGLKQRLFARNFFFGYTQKSFWQVYNSDDSRPFRETNYNPELFYRWKPDRAGCRGCGLDIGIDHESNGQEVTESRSWNRIILALYRESGDTLLHLRAWYRIPEDPKKTPDDPKGDDNPDIEDYYGHGELRLQRKLFGARNHMAALMVRGNPSTGKGALQIDYSLPLADDAFWSFNLWHGYGESLIDYNTSITRLSVGIMLAR